MKGGKDMIELKKDALVFSFREIHPWASLKITFERTLRIPDDEKTYPLPPSLGHFPLRHVDDFNESVPLDWMRHGGVMLPMYQSEALWLSFSSTLVPGQRHPYPFAIKVAAGKINAVTGENWSEGLHRRPQDYMVSEEQPWLDGYCVRKGIIRQFVAMPLGAGYSAEEQIAGEGKYGGIQLAVYPMKRQAFEYNFPEKPDKNEDIPAFMMQTTSQNPFAADEPDMGLAPGGTMRQDIIEDPFEFDDWDTGIRGRCFVHIANSMTWRSITGQDPPTVPLTADEYNKRGFPWFDYYSEGESLPGSTRLNSVKSVKEKGKEKKDVPLPENKSVDPYHTLKLNSYMIKNRVREGDF